MTLHHSPARRALQSRVEHPLKGTDELRDASRGERLQRVMADAGVASRRACEDLIREGKVRVNGRVVTDLPIWVDPAEDTIVVNGRPLRPAAEPVYVMLFKPARTLAASADEPGADRRTVLDIVKHPSGARLFPVGRLDYDTTGLILLTNDGDIAHKLTHPRFGVQRVYEAVVAGIVTPPALAELNRRLAPRPPRKGKKPAQADTTPPIEILDVSDGRTLLRVTLRGSAGGSVQELLGKLGHHVKHLERVGFGPLVLTGLAAGQWRDLERREITALKRSLQPGAAAPAVPQRRKKATAQGKGRKPGRPQRRPASERAAGDDSRPERAGRRPGSSRARPGGSTGGGRGRSGGARGGRSSGGKRNSGGKSGGRAGGRSGGGSSRPGANRNRRRGE